MQHHTLHEPCQAKPGILLYSGALPVMRSHRTPLVHHKHPIMYTQYVIYPIVLKLLSYMTYGMQAEIEVCDASGLHGCVQGYLAGEHSSPVNIVSYSPNGLYALTGDNGGRVVLWDVQHALPLATAQAPEPKQGSAESVAVSALAWHPSLNEAAVVRLAGRAFWV